MFMVPFGTGPKTARSKSNYFQECLCYNVTYQHNAQLKAYTKKEDEASENCNVVITSWRCCVFGCERKTPLFGHPEINEIRNQWYRFVGLVCVFQCSLLFIYLNILYKNNSLFINTSMYTCNGNSATLFLLKCDNSTLSVYI